MTHERWAQLDRVALITFGKDLVTDRLEPLGCTVSRARNPIDGKLAVRTASGRSLEVFVSTQRVGGYAFWTKRRLQLARDRFAAVVLLGDDPEPALYLVPSEAWLVAVPPLADRDYLGRKSEPEYGIELQPAQIPLLQRFAWTSAKTREYFA